MNTRREFLGCSAAALLLMPAKAAAKRKDSAPRVFCHHTGCRYHRPGVRSPGLCALALKGAQVAYEAEVSP